MNAPEQIESPGRSIPPKMVVAALIGVGLLAFVAQNTDEMRVNWLVFSFTAPLWVMLAITVALSFLVGWWVGRPGRKDRKAIKKR